MEKKYICPTFQVMEVGVEGFLCGSFNAVPDTSSNPQSTNSIQIWDSETVNW